MPEAPNIAREIVLGTGMNVHTDAYSVSRACATSFRAVANVAESLMAGTIRAGIAGGADSSSVLPIGVSKQLARILVDANKARTTGAKLKLFSRLRLRDLMPVPPAVAEYSTGLRMGDTAEQMAKPMVLPANSRMRWRIARISWQRKPVGGQTDQRSDDRLCTALPGTARGR